VIPFLILWVIANYTFGYSLGRISASAASSIMSTNTAMVCILSSLLLHENTTIEKVLAVFFAISGVTVIALDKEFAGDWIGIVLVICSALSAALYKVLFKKFNGNGTLGQVSLFMTFLGLINLFVNVIPSIILALLRVDKIEWDYVPWLALSGSALLGLS
jgi:solute carrier family 35 protein F3/4